MLCLSVLGAILLVACGDGGHATVKDPPMVNPSAIGYVANAKSNTVDSFLLDEQTGGLAHGMTASTGTLPAFPAVTPDRRFLFVSNMGDSTISRFVLDGNGGMQSVGSPIHLLSADAQLGTIAISPAGQFLYVGAGSKSIEAFRIDSQTGDLQPIQNSPYPVSSKGYALTLSHSGQFLYAAGDSDVIDIFTVDGSTGVLSPLPAGPVQTGLTNCDIAIDPSDKWLLVATCHAEKLLIFSIDSSGTLQERPDLSVSTGYLATHMAIARNGRLLYIADPFFDNGILEYTLDPSSGAVIAVPGSPVHDGQSPTSVAVSPASNVLVVARTNPGHIVSYRIDPQSGALSPVFGPGPDVGIVTGDSPNNVLVVPK